MNGYNERGTTGTSRTVRAENLLCRVGFCILVEKCADQKTSPRTEATGPGRIPHPHEVATNHITGPAERTLSRAPQAFRGSPTAETSRRFGAVGHSLFYFGDFPGATAAPGGVRGEIELRGTRLISLYYSESSIHPCCKRSSRANHFCNSVIQTVLTRKNVPPR
jgi:hypothetical protein